MTTNLKTKGEGHEVPGLKEGDENQSPDPKDKGKEKAVPGPDSGDEK